MSPNARPLRAVAGVALWLVDLDARDFAEPALSAEEEARAAHFAFERDRARYFATHRALRRLLATQAGLDPRRMRFFTGPYGKPALDGAPRCRFSIADCDDVALIGIVHGDEDVGVDVERVRPVPDRFDLAASLFTPVEQAELKDVPPPRRDVAFLRGWTRKEACMKAIGSGLAMEARQVETGLAPLERRLTIEAPHGRFEVEVHSLELGDALVAAVARVLPSAG
jgi:4'-phosphopantetheinyl transferase